MAKYQITVSVRTAYLPEQSSETDDRYAFSYTVRITNTGEMAAQLISRHWLITDADENVKEVKGSGVVGEQPLIPPGETYEYTSGSVISTKVGSMHGTYQMVAEDGTQFDAVIEPFTLAVPRILN